MVQVGAIGIAPVRKAVGMDSTAVNAIVAEFDIIILIRYAIPSAEGKYTTAVHITGHNGFAIRGRSKKHSVDISLPPQTPGTIVEKCNVFAELSLIIGVPSTFQR